MNPETRARIEAWLRYGADLGLAPYFRDRAPIAAPASAAEPAAASPPPAPAPAPKPKSAPLPAPPAVPTRAAAPAPGSSLPFVPVAPSRSLFDVAERIENDTLPRIREEIGDCTRCRLHQGRTNIVYGVGNPKAELVFVGEGPGHDEDVQGEPFVGRAGKLLTQMIEAMSLRREDVYICNVVKCRPPENRLPERDEISTCSPFLFRQLAAIQPKVICCLGACAAQTLLETTQGISRFRGEWFDFRGSKLIATYHPAYLLRNPNAKSEVWRDLQKVMAVLGLQPRKR
ncbi:MAG TPA: uracil-DNA glycosylase [Candidatus Sulfotelmatobacter sp.]|nr:uracil-DNA glycosylase [Candidatus Sulfotelmatobacter sp.]